MIDHVLINCLSHIPMTTLVRLPCSYTQLLAAHTPIWDRKQHETPQMKQDLSQYTQKLISQTRAW